MTTAMVDSIWQSAAELVGTIKERIDGLDDARRTHSASLVRLNKRVANVESELANEQAIVSFTIEGAIDFRNTLNEVIEDAITQGNRVGSPPKIKLNLERNKP